MITQINLEEVITYFHEGKLVENENAFLASVKDEEYYEKGVVYSAKILEAHIKVIKYVNYLDDITSSIARCVEYGLKLQLDILIKYLDKLTLMGVHKDGVTVLDKRLLLRKCDFPCYSLAKQYGFVDYELEKRIVFIQRLMRKQPINDLKYEGPSPIEFFQVDNVINYNDLPVERILHSLPRYWGYRHTLYFIRWNRSQRYEIVNLIKLYWHGDCRYQAYVDYLESKTEDNLKFEQI
jgi:hypothetical protein